MADTQRSPDSSSSPRSAPDTAQEGGANQLSKKGNRANDMGKEPAKDRGSNDVPYSGNTGTSAGQYSGGSGGTGGGNR